MIGKLLVLTALAVASAEFPSTCQDGEHLLLPHETDCSKFYYCVFGAKAEVASSCAPGTVFSFEEQQCDFPENVNCVFNTILPSERDHHEFLPNGCPKDIHIHFLLPHEIDCTKFYYCNFGRKVERDCAPGTAFNFDIQVCDHPENVDCKTLDPVPAEPIIELNDQGCPIDFNIHYLVSHERDCSKFYICSNGNRFETSCVSGLWFNGDTQICDWPENVKCNVDNNENESESNENKNDSDENKNENDSDENKNENESDENKNENESDENKPEVESDENKIELLENGCPADWSIHKLLPHEWDCTKFYYCVYGKLVERSCAPGTAFNYEIQVCDWPQNVKCANKPVNEQEESKEDEDENDNEDESKENSKESDEEHHKSNEHETTDDGWLNNGCPAEFDIHYLLPDEEDCSKFYYCVDGQLIPEWCASGLVFNPINQVCDWPYNYKCSKQEPKPVENSGSNEDKVASSENTESQENQNESQENKNESQENQNESGWNTHESDENKNASQENAIGSLEDNDNSCPLDWDPNVLIPSAEDCSKFYYCVDGQLIPEWCASGLVFNPIIQVCDWPYNYECSQQGPKPAENSGSNEDKVESSEKKDSEENQNESQDNKNESQENKNESQENRNESDEIKNASQENEIGSVENDNSCPLDWDPNVLIPNAEDCSKFYYCVYGQLSERECPAGTLFDPQSQICDWADHVTCFNARCSSCNVAPWSHYTCGKYWRCDGDKVVLVQCSEGLHFNGETCDFAEKAVCQ